MKTYTVTIVNEKESITDVTPINTIITVTGLILLLLGITLSNLYFTGNVWGNL